MTLSTLFPRLTPDNHRVTSAATRDYNCIAWAAGDTGRWWQPGVHWPVDVPPDDHGIAALEQAMQTLGYVDCGLNDELQPGWEKVALYGTSFVYTHAARQLGNGKWTSKLGALADIEHDTLDDIAGGDYGEVVEIMKRPIQGAR
jgi:hypothetical protein